MDYKPKGFNRFYEVNQLKSPKERLALLKEVFADMVVSGGTEEGLVMPISSLFHSISQAYNNPTFDEAISATHKVFVDAGMIKALVDVGNKCIDDEEFREFDQNNFLAYYCAHILSSVVSDRKLRKKAVDEGAFDYFMRLYRGELGWTEARTACRGLSTLAGEDFIHLFTPDIVKLALEYFLTSWTKAYTEFIQKPSKRKPLDVDLMTRGEGGSDEATFLGFVWMENLRSWSGLIVHLYFAAEPLKGTQIFIDNPHLFDMWPISFYYENQLTETPDEFGSIAMWGGMTLESMASTELGRKTILNNPNVVRVIQENARGPLANHDRLLKVILACISNEDSRARAFEYWGDIICDSRYGWFEDNDGRITQLGEMLAEIALKPYYEIPNYKPANQQEKDCIDELVQNIAKNHTATSAAGKARIEKAKKLKDEGNKNIGSNLQVAIKCYQEAIFYCPESQKELIVALFSNLAEAYSRLKATVKDQKTKDELSWKIIKWSTRAQCMEPRHPKTLWKRACALCDLGLWRAALHDINDFSSAAKSLTTEMEKIVSDCSCLSHPYTYLRAHFGPIDLKDKADDDDSDDEYGGMFSGFNKSVNEERLSSRRALFGVLFYADEHIDLKTCVTKMTSTTTTKQ